MFPALQHYEEKACQHLTAVFTHFTLTYSQFGLHNFCTKFKTSLLQATGSDIMPRSRLKETMTQRATLFLIFVFCGFLSFFFFYLSECFFLCGGPPCLTLSEHCENRKNSPSQLMLKIYLYTYNIHRQKCKVLQGICETRDFA